jgi:hypothetical protein
MPLLSDVRIEGAPLDMDLDAGRLSAALERGALLAGEYVKQVWGLAAIELGAFDTGEYRNGITDEGRVEVTRMPDGGVGVGVELMVTNTAPHASIVEEGHGAFRLADKIDWGNTGGSIKIGESGRPYLHIPFRHTVPGQPGGGMTKSASKAQMPQAVYEQAKRQVWRVANNRGPVRAPAPAGGGQGRFLQRDTYRTEDLGKGGTETRMRRGQTSTSFAPDPHTGQLVQERRGARVVAAGRRGKDLVNPEWKTSRFEGMIKTGGPGHTRYLTIRTLTPDSDGWNIPAMTGYYVAARTAAAIDSGPELGELFSQAVMSVIDPSAAPGGSR